MARYKLDRNASGFPISAHPDQPKGIRLNKMIKSLENRISFVVNHPEFLFSGNSKQ